jgi:hypothetical protein
VGLKGLWGGKQVQRTGSWESTSDIILEHELHAGNGKSPGNHITRALGREKLPIQLFGGGIIHSTKSGGGSLSSPKV